MRSECPIDTSTEALFQLIRIALDNTSDYTTITHVDWQEVYRMSLSQNVWALVFDAIGRCRDHSDNRDTFIDEDLWYTWLGQSYVHVCDTKAKWSAAKDLGALWCEKGLKTVVLKGLAFAQYYPHPLYRSFCDIDVYLYDKWELGNCEIEQEGITVSRDFYKNSSFTYHGLYVENHKFCSPIRGGNNRKEYELFLQGLLQKGPMQKIARTELLCPPPLFNMLFFMSHAQSHFLYEGGIKLRSVCDWGVLLKTYSQCNSSLWAVFDEKCVSFGMQEFSHAMSRLAERICGVTLPFVCKTTTKKEEMLLADIMYGTGIETNRSKWRTRWNICKTIIHSRWKFSMFSNQTMLSALLQMVASFFIEKNPVLHEGEGI